MNIFQRNAKKLVAIPVMSGAASVVFIRLIEASPIAIGFYRLGLSALIFGIPILLGGYKHYKGTTTKELLLCILSGFILFCHFVTWFTAIKTTTIASAAVLFSLHPLAVLVATFFILKKKVKAKAIVGILVALSGGAITALANQTLYGSHIFGDSIALISGILFGAYFFIGQIMRSKMATLNYIFIVFTSCFVFFAIAMVVTGTPFIGYRTEDYLLMIGLTIICQVLAHAMYNWCMGYVSSLYISVFTSIQAVIAVFYGIIFFQEIPILFQWIGAFVAVSGLLYYNVNSHETPKDGKLGDG